MVISVAVMLANTISSNAQEPGEIRDAVYSISDDDAGYDEDEFFEKIQLNENNAPIDTSSDYHISGYIQEKLMYGLNTPDSGFAYYRDEPEITRLETSLVMHFDARINEDWVSMIGFRAWYNDYYRRHSLNVSYWEDGDTKKGAELRDAYIDGRLSDGWWLKIGRQTVVWGESDVLSITDVVNPRDYSVFGQFDLEDMRLPVAATRLSYLDTRWSIDVVAMLEYRRNKYGNETTDFDPFIRLRGDNVSIQQVRSRESLLDDPEYAARVYRNFNGGDIGFVYADVYEDAPNIRLDTSMSGPGQIVFEPALDRITMYGFSGNIVAGTWLFKTEAAIKREKDFMTSNPAEFLSKDQITVMGGLDYIYSDDFRISLEAYTESVKKYSSAMLDKKRSNGYLSRMILDFYSDKARVEFFWNRLTQDDGDIFRLTFDLDIMDTFTWSSSLVTYCTDNIDADMYPYRKNETFISSIRYSF